jgi:dolichyl-phosphate-mannose--protein O-mannosyl transferase
MFSKQFLDERPQLASFLHLWKVNSMAIYIIFILFSSFVTFVVVGRQDYNDQSRCFPAVNGTCHFAGFNRPQSLFWDENYHIASANRYMRGEYFMEYHPPLGKLIIALGEKIFNLNANLDTSMVSGFTEKACVNGTCYGKDDCPKDKQCVIEKSVGNDQDSIPYISGMDVKFRQGFVPQNGEQAVFNFFGVRFFPVMFAWLASIVLFYIIYLLTKNQHVAFVFSLAYVFDNAIIVHSRGAMLDGIQLFFVLVSLAYLIRTFQKNLYSFKHYVIFGMLVGLVVATKVNGLILAPLALLFALREFFTLSSNIQDQVKGLAQKFVPLFLISFVFNYIASKFLLNLKSIKDVSDPVLLENINMRNQASTSIFVLFLILTTFLIFYFGNKIINNFFKSQGQFESKSIQTNSVKFSDYLINITGKLAAFALMVGVVFCAVFFVHFSLAKTPIGNNNFAKFTSEATKEAIKTGQTGNLAFFIPQLQDNLKYISESQKGVPAWDPTKGDNEAGSLPFTWPVGNHAIRYYASAYTKSETVAGQINQNVRYTSYLYLVVNLTVWLLVLIGVLLSLALIISRFVFGYKVDQDQKSQQSFWWMSLFTGLYVAYMISVMQIERVMYLYHYFLPLIFGLIGSAVLFGYYFQKRNKLIMAGLLIFIGILIFLNFLYFAPFSYNFDFTEETFDARRWLKYWGLMYYK